MKELTDRNEAKKMGDLISRSQIYNYIKTEINPYGKPFEGTAYELGLKIMRYIDNMHTEYDLERVMEKFEERKSKFDCRSCKHFYIEKKECNEDCTDALIEALFEIVKNGG